jgi:WD domain, G-beta repeat
MVHSAETGDSVFTAQLHVPGVGGARRVAWSPKGDWLVSCGEDGRVDCVAYPKGKQQILLLEADKPVWSVDWSPDNRYIAAVGEEGRAWIWSTNFLHSFSETKAVAGRHSTSSPEHAKPAPTPKGRTHGKFRPFHWLRKSQTRAALPAKAAGASSGMASTHLPCSRIRSTNRSTASISGILNFTAFLPT